MATKKIAKKTTKKTAAKKQPAKAPYVLVRCSAAGVHAGELVSRKGDEVRLRNARRIWHWSGAASLSELAVYGASNPSECRFGAAVEDHTVIGACEIMVCRPSAEAMIRGQAEWRA